MSRRMAVSGISGFAWGCLAFLLIGSGANDAMMGAVASAPVIGLGMGQLSRGFCSRPFVHRWLLALGTLYFAAALFGVMGGILETLHGMHLARVGPPVPMLTKVTESIFAVVLGVTASGYVLALSPLAYANHLMVDAVGWD